MKEEKQNVDVYIAVGSNIQPEYHIPEALRLLQDYVRVTDCSTFYRTPAIDRPDQPDYRNGVFKARTDIPARTLKFNILRMIEQQLGRVRSGDDYAPRTIDLDIALYGDHRIDEPGLRVPDPAIRHRAFLAGPLLELDPELVLADTGRPLREVPTAYETSSLTPDLELTRRLRERIRG